MSKRGVIYCRVSTEDQETNGSSLQYQHSTCLKFAKELGLSVPDELVFVEQFSGAYFDRPLLSEVLSLAKLGKIDFVIFTKRDRVARDQFIYQRIMNELENARVQVYFAEEKLTGDESMDNFMGSTIVGFAQWEREQIRKRTHAGRIQHAREGKWPFSSIPFGYFKNLETKKLEIHEDERWIVLEIVRLFLEEDYTLWKIADEFTKRKILPPSMSEKGSPVQKSMRKRRANAVDYWSVVTVHRILSKAPMYTGIYQAFKKKYKMDEVVGERPKEDWVEIKMPPIITNKQGGLILDKLESNRRFAKKRAIRSYMLQGKLLCDCQVKYPHFAGYFHNQKELRNYRCGMYRTGNISEDRRCSNHVSGLKIEGIIIETIKELLLDPDYIFDLAFNESSNGTPSSKLKGGRIHELQIFLSEISSKHARNEELYVEGNISKERFNAIKEKLEKSKDEYGNEINKEIRTIQDELSREMAKRDWKDIAKELEEMVESFFANANYDEMKELVNLMIDRVIVPTNRENPVRVVMKIPFDSSKAKYLEEEIITWTDDNGKEYDIMGTGFMVPKKLHLDPTKKPLRYRTVEFQPPKEFNGDSGNDEIGLPDTDPILLKLLREKYVQFYECHQRKSNNSHESVGFCFLCARWKEDLNSNVESSAKR